MSLYRCAACGSPNVMTDNKKEGYDYVKGAIGTAVLGVGGAVAGLDGKEKKFINVLIAEHHFLIACRKILKHSLIWV